VSAPVGLIIMIIGAAGVWYPFSPYYKPSSPGRPLNEPSSSGSQAATPTAVAPLIRIAFTSSSDGAEVEGRFGVAGTAPDLGGDKLWLFIWSNNKTIPGMVYYRTSYAPLDVINGTWSANVGPLAEPGKEIGAILQLKLVRANSQCSDRLTQHATSSSSGAPVIPKLPPGCTDAAPPLHVKKAS
jgi:hypothetical protein